MAYGVCYCTGVLVNVILLVSTLCLVFSDRENNDSLPYFGVTYMREGGVLAHCEEVNNRIEERIKDENKL